MMTHTLIPDVEYMQKVTLWLLSMGSFVTARHIYLRRGYRYLSFMQTNAIIKFFIAFYAVFYLSFVDNIQIYGMRMVIFICLSPLIAWLILKLEKMLLEIINKYTSHREITCEDMPRILRDKNIRNAYQHLQNNPELSGYDFLSLMFVAFSEEVLFRLVPYVLTMCEVFYLHFGSLMLAVLFFAASHVRNHFLQILLKLPLSIITMMALLATKSIVPAMAVHASYNFIIYQSNRKATGLY